MNIDYVWNILNMRVIEIVNNSWTWKVLSFMKKEKLLEHKENCGFQSNKCLPQLEELNGLEKDMINLINQI